MKGWYVCRVVQVVVTYIVLGVADNLLSQSFKYDVLLKPDTVGDSV